MPADDEADRLAGEVAEAKRVADQERLEGMAQLRSEQAASERAQGKREGLAEAHTEDQDKQLLSLQEMHRSVLAELKDVNRRLALVEVAVQSWVENAKTAGERAVSTRQFWLGVAVLAVTLFGLLYGKHI